MSDSHPFLADDFLISWSALTPDHIVADVTKAIETGKANIEAIKAVTPENATFENTFGALETATEDLDRSWGRVNHLDSVANSDDLREALNKMLPLVSEFSSSISLNDDLWRVLKSFAESDAVTSLTELQKRFVQETCDDFTSAGADLAPDAKKRMFEINSELAQVTQKFGENVLDSTNAWELYLDDESRLAGLPDSAKASAAEDAKSKGKEGQWRITQHFPSMFPSCNTRKTTPSASKSGKAPAPSDTAVRVTTPPSSGTSSAFARKRPPSSIMRTLPTTSCNAAWPKWPGRPRLHRRPSRQNRRALQCRDSRTRSLQSRKNRHSSRPAPTLGISILGRETSQGTLRLR